LNSSLLKLFRAIYTHCHYRTKGDDALLVECYMKYNTPKWLLKVDKSGISSDVYFDVIIFTNSARTETKQNVSRNTESWICTSRHVQWYPDTTHLLAQIIVYDYLSCALEVPGCHRLLTFDFEQLGKLTFFI